MPSNAVPETFVSAPERSKPRLIDGEDFQGGFAGRRPVLAGHQIRAGLGRRIRFPSTRRRGCAHQVTFWPGLPSGAPGSSGRMTLFARGSGSSVTVSQNVIQLLLIGAVSRLVRSSFLPWDGGARIRPSRGRCVYRDTVTVQRAGFDHVKMGSLDDSGGMRPTAQGIPQLQAMLGCQAAPGDRRGRRWLQASSAASAASRASACTAYVDVPEIPLRRMPSP